MYVGGDDIPEGIEADTDDGEEGGIALIINLL